MSNLTSRQRRSLNSPSNALEVLENTRRSRHPKGSLGETEDNLYFSCLDRVEQIESQINARRIEVNNYRRLLNLNPNSQRIIGQLRTAQRELVELLTALEETKSNTQNLRAQIQQREEKWAEFKRTPAGQFF